MNDIYEYILEQQLRANSKTVVFLLKKLSRKELHDFSIYFMCSKYFKY